MNDRETGERTQGRSISVEALGANRESLEMAALDEARQFFGPEPQLEVVADYKAHGRANEPPERRYFGRITVRMIES